MTFVRLHSSHQLKLRKIAITISLLAIVMLLSSALLSLYGARIVGYYLPLHTILESFTVVVASLVFSVGWNAYRRELPSNILLLACAFLGVGMLDFSHMLSFTGMPDFVTPSGPKKAIIFWLAARSLAAITLLAVALRHWRPLSTANNRYFMLAPVLILVVCVHWLFLFHDDLLPVVFIPGQGLTAFKIHFEYAIIAINLFTALVLLMRMRNPLPFNAAGLLGVVCTMAMSEFFFTRFVDFSDTYNMLGHIYKIISYLFLYFAIFVETIELPYNKLHQSQNQLQATLNAMPEILFEVGEDGHIYLYRAAATEQLSGSTNEFSGKSISDIMSPDAVEIFLSSLHETAQKGHSQGKQIELILPGGKRWFELSVSRKTVEPRQEPRFIVLMNDITERKRVEADLRTLKDDLEVRVAERTAQLEAANKELEAFSYSVSHDLRTPLRAIDGFSHMLLDDHSDKLDDEGKRLLKVVRDNTGRMGQLIDDILKFSRTGREEIIRSEIDMEKLAREVSEELQPSVASGKLQMEIGHIPPAKGDRAMMHQVFVNLLSNAIKFSRTREPAIIKVGGTIEWDEAVYFVRDNGAGFDMRYVDKLFGVFQRLHSVNEFEGTGIGLAIVKRIITRHAGRVWAEGKPNEGATIYFSLPTPQEKEHG